MSYCAVQLYPTLHSGYDFAYDAVHSSQDASTPASEYTHLFAFTFFSVSEIFLSFTWSFWHVTAASFSNREYHHHFFFLSQQQSFHFDLPNLLPALAFFCAAWTRLQHTFILSSALRRYTKSCNRESGFWFGGKEIFLLEEQRGEFGGKRNIY